MDGTNDIYELDELLGAYALDAVDADEKRRVEDYLRSNPRAAAEVAEHREVATMLAFTGMDAPDDVWSRIAHQIEGDAPAPGPELARVIEFETPGASAAPTSSRRSTWWLGAAAASVVLLAGALVFTNLSSDSSDPIADAFAAVADAEDSSTTELVSEAAAVTATGVIGSDGRGYLDATELPALSSGQTYQLWGVLSETGDAVSLGIFGAEPGIATFTVDGPVDALALTVEQSPGVISDGNLDGAYIGAFG